MSRDAYVSHETSRQFGKRQGAKAAKGSAFVRLGVRSPKVKAVKPPLSAPERDTMTALRPLACAVALLTTLPLALAADDNPTTPAAATAFLSGGKAIVSWVPGAETADAFNVYAIANGSRTLIETTPGSDLKAEVDAPPPGPCVALDPEFPPDVVVGCTGGLSYAVSAMKGGIESPMTAAALVVGTPCIQLDPDGPAVWVGCMGGVGVLGKANLRTHLALMVY